MCWLYLDTAHTHTHTTGRRVAYLYCHFARRAANTNKVNANGSTNSIDNGVSTTTSLEQLPPARCECVPSATGNAQFKPFFWPNPAGGRANCQLANTWHVRRKTKVELIACQQGKPDGNSTMTMSSYDMNKLIVIKMTTPAAFNKLPDLTE